MHDIVNDLSPKYFHPFIIVSFLGTPSPTHAEFSSRFFVIPIALSFTLVVSGVNPLVSAGVGLLGGLIASFGKVGVEFSTDFRSFREYHALFGWRIGRWQQLPIISGVTLKYFSEVIPTDSTYSWGIWNDKPTIAKELIVMLSIQNKSTGIIIGRFSVQDTHQAVGYVQGVAKDFGVPARIYLPGS